MAADAQMSEASSSAGVTSAAHGTDAEVPERVESLLKSCESFGEFKSKRQFCFLHLFAGPKDVLADALKASCEKEGSKLKVESYDKLIDKGHDLLAEQPFKEILR